MFGNSTLSRPVFSFYVCKYRDAMSTGNINSSVMYPRKTAVPSLKYSMFPATVFTLLFSLTFTHRRHRLSLENLHTRCTHTYTHTNSLYQVVCMYMHQPTMSMVMGTGVYRIACNVSKSPWTCRFYVIFLLQL